VNKVALVALREYLDNLRTKTFWFGVLSFPIIILIVFAASYLMAKAKQARPYAVVDGSGWLLPAVEERAVAEDVRALL